MSGFEDGVPDRKDDKYELPGIGQLPTERTTFRVADRFHTLPQILREDLSSCCEASCDPVLSVLWIPDIDEEPRPESVLDSADGEINASRTGCVMELPWQDGTFYFLNT